MAKLLNRIADFMLALLGLGLAAWFGFIALLAPWWLSAAGAVALVAVWPAHKRWARAQAEHRAYMAPPRA